MKPLAAFATFLCLFQGLLCDGASWVVPRTSLGGSGLHCTPPSISLPTRSLTTPEAERHPADVKKAVPTTTTTLQQNCSYLFPSRFQAETAGSVADAYTANHEAGNLAFMYVDFTNQSLRVDESWNMSEFNNRRSALKYTQGIDGFDRHVQLGPAVSYLYWVNVTGPHCLVTAPMLWPRDIFNWRTYVGVQRSKASGGDDEMVHVFEQTTSLGPAGNITWRLSVPVKGNGLSPRAMSILSNFDGFLVRVEYRFVTFFAVDTFDPATELFVRPEACPPLFERP